MTKQELNRDVKRLRIYYLNNKNNTICKLNYEYLTSEFKRLYYADKNFEYLNKKNVLFMFRFNLMHRIIPLHLFGIQIDI